MSTAPPGPGERSPWLSAILGEPVTVSYGRARTTPVVLRRGRGRLELRLHGFFRAAPDDVWSALAAWLRAGRRARAAGERLDAWIQSALQALPPAPRPSALELAGEAHDLGALSDHALATEFALDFTPDRPPPAVTWGRRAPSRSRRSLRLGSFEPERQLVRVHPVLDQCGVPAWFVTYVLKHELLHAVHPPYRDAAGRWIHHGEEFREREATWPEYRDALRWEERNLPRLIRSAREGSRLRPRAEAPELPSTGRVVAP